MVRICPRITQPGLPSPMQNLTHSGIYFSCQHTGMKQELPTSNLVFPFHWQNLSPVHSQPPCGSSTCPLLPSGDLFHANWQHARKQSPLSCQRSVTACLCQLPNKSALLTVVTWLLHSPGRAGCVSTRRTLLYNKSYHKHPWAR